MWCRPGTWSPNLSALASRVRWVHAAIDANRSASMYALNHASLFVFSLHAVAPSAEGTWAPLHRPFCWSRSPLATSPHNRTEVEEEEQWTQDFPAGARTPPRAHERPNPFLPYSGYMATHGSTSSIHQGAFYTRLHTHHPATTPATISTNLATCKRRYTAHANRPHDFSANKLMDANARPLRYLHACP